VLAGGQNGQQAADLIAEAREMAEAGDEEGCMQKVTEAKSLLASTEQFRKILGRPQRAQL
jgi:hypothetical protein